MQTIVKMFNNLKSWFANIELSNIRLFSPSYAAQLFIVTDTIEKLDGYARTNGEKKAVKITKRIIANRMKQRGINREFDEFLKKKGIM